MVGCLDSNDAPFVTMVLAVATRGDKDLLSLLSATMLTVDVTIGMSVDTMAAPDRGYPSVHEYL